MVNIFRSMISKLRIKRQKFLIKRTYKLNQIDEFTYQIEMRRLKLVSLGQSFISIRGLYQTHPKVNVPGLRPTLSRVNNYGLLEYVSKSDKVMDIGGNVGFFSMYLSEFVESVDVIEMDKGLVDIGNLTKEYLGIKNVIFFNEDIRKLQTDKKYDLIITMAIHGHLGISLGQYISKISQFLTPNGKIFIESHPGLEDGNILKEELTQLNLNIIHHGITDDHAGNIRSFYLTKTT